jgi:hypothetical protein
MRATDATTKEAIKVRILVFNVPFGDLSACRCQPFPRTGKTKIWATQYVRTVAKMKVDEEERHRHRAEHFGDRSRRPRSACG